jgi:hypothetical protein
MNLKQITAGMTAGAIAMALATSAMAGSDGFNRPHLGASWVVTSGTLAISNHELVGTNLAIGYQPASNVDSAASNTVFLGGTDLEYGAVAVGDVAAGTNAFVKIQQQNGGGTFDHAAFYTGDNGGGDFFTLSSPVPSPAILDVFFCGTVATMRITSSAGVQLYTFNYGTTFGGGAGLGTYGAIRLDNFLGFVTSCADVPAGARPASEMPRDKDWSRAD